MTTTLFRGLFCLFLAATAVRAADSFADVMKRATQDYGERLRKASEELNTTRERIAREKAPLLRDMRAAEDRLLAAETDINRMNTNHEQADNTRHKLLKDFDALRKSTTYITTIAHDGLTALNNGVFPGEEQTLSDQLAGLQQKFDDTVTGPSAAAAIDVAEFIFARTERELGGYTVPGRAVLATGNQVLPGTFALVGPETFFSSSAGDFGGVVRARDGGRLPMVYPIETWKTEERAPLFEGKMGAIPADASNGKALKLKQTSGTLLDHIAKGGVVAYAILGVGLISLLMILQKINELGRMKVDSRETVQAFLSKLSAGSIVEAKASLGTLRPTTRELFAEGLRHLDEPKDVLEERLQAVLLEQRLHFERRLPLLAVIATAAPLMGLLGTVVGMIKTFALITVFGTGNAGKLSSGISEVLVATELGLAVAIPTLVIHGFLAHRVHRNLSVLERHALQFATAAQRLKSTSNGVVSRVSAVV